MRIIATAFLIFATFSVYAQNHNPIQRTLSIIKPDAVQEKHIGDIIQRFEKGGLKVISMKMIHLTPAQASEFYAVHKSKPFFPELVEYISSGPIVVQVLEGEDAIAVNRKIMGATDPKKADKGTLRADFAESIGRNAVHGSDSFENAKKEIAFFFSDLEMH